jgi:hypothetical protein
LPAVWNKIKKRDTLNIVNFNGTQKKLYNQTHTRRSDFMIKY